MQKLQFSKTNISSIPFSEKTTVYVDQEVHWLQLLVGKRSKTFYAARWHDGQPLRVKIGDASLINPVVARKRAMEICTKLAQGEDPRVRRLAQVTLQTVWDDYRRVRTLRPGTLRTYQNILDNHFAHLLGRDILKITEDDVATVHVSLGRAGKEQFANCASRVLNSLLSFAMSKYKANGKPLLALNPCAYLTQMKLWYRPKRRKGRLAANQVSAWVEHLGTLENQIMADCLMLILLTGLRANEAMSLSWANVNLESKMFTIPGGVAKNHDDHTLPMTDTIEALFKRRLAAKKCDYVFPGHLRGQPLKSLTFARRLVTEKSGIQFTAHDLRRTFITAAESLDISGYALKRLLNHRNEEDVTGGYIIWNPIRLLSPLQAIEQRLLHGEKGSW